MRRWHYHAVTNQPHSVIVTPTLVQFLAGDADNFITNIHIGRSFNTAGTIPNLGGEVPRWYGDTIGFWDGDALITWTSNIQGWKVHGNPEFSGEAADDRDLHAAPRQAPASSSASITKASSTTPRRSCEPIRMTRTLERISGFEDGDPYTFIECVQTIYPDQRPRDAGGRGQGDPVQSARTCIDRPWAKIWEEYHEKGMQRPQQEKELIKFD